MPLTPNIGIYVPVAGETSYQDSFMAGMVNIDQHDHSGGPNGGVPIATSGIADGSITYKKLNSNVADTSTGIGTHVGMLANQLYLLGNLASIYKLNIPTPTAGFLAINGNAASALTLTGTANQIAITNPQGIAGNPVFSLISPTNTWTPTLEGQTTAGTTTYGTQSGTYIRVGNIVTASFIITGSAATGTGNVLISGLPFPCVNSINTFGVFFLENATDFPLPVNCTYLASIIVPTTPSNLLVTACGTGGWSFLQVSNTSFNVQGTITYQVAT